ncbi:MAG: hypothetical protein JRI25_08970 [Deltaproteobacteria bacterium]|nr:hypothetical protein [Deltaproteobacteria bacterium]
MNSGIGLALALGTGACKAPPEAPEVLEDLAVYLYTQHQDDDPEVMVVGADQLRTWFREEWDEEDDDGYTIASLDQDAVEVLNDSASYQHPDANASRSVEAMLGVAVGTHGAHDVDEYAGAMVDVDQDEVFPNDFAEYERTWYLADPACFRARECLRIEALEYMKSRLPLGMSTTGETYNQYVWVELEAGWAMVHRNWQVYPPDASVGALEVDDQFYLNLFLPGVGGAYRLQATWMVGNQSSVPENMVLALTSNHMFDNSESLEEYLDGE